MQAEDIESTQHEQRPPPPPRPPVIIEVPIDEPLDDVTGTEITKGIGAGCDEAATAAIEKMK